MSEFKVGDKVWIEPRCSTSSWRLGEATVTKVGRKWVTIQDPGRRYLQERFRPDTLEVDGKGYSPAIRVYQNKQTWIDERWSGKLSTLLRRVFDNYGRLPYTNDQMVAALTALGVELPPKPEA